MDLHQLLYVSKSTRKMPHYEVEDLVQKSMTVNARKEITGLLLYGGGYFLQVLEGHKATIAATFQKVARDPRHKSVRRMLFTRAEGRLFPRWQMGLLNFDAQADLDLDLLALAGQLEGRSPALPRGAARTMNLIKEFRRQNEGPITASA